MFLTWNGRQWFESDVSCSACFMEVFKLVERRV